MQKHGPARVTVRYGVNRLLHEIDPSVQILHLSGALEPGA